MAQAGETKSVWVTLCKLLAPWAALIVFSAPFPTIQKCLREKTVGALPLLPYSSMIVSSFLWLTYGFLIQEPAVWQTNMAGLCLSVYYFLRFIKYAPSKALTLPGSIQQHVNVISYIFCLTVSIVYIWPISNPTSVVGNFAVAFCVAMFASPLSALKTVMKTKSAKTIPLPFTVATVINCLLWSVVGIFDLNDFNIYFPNLLGLSCGLFQVALKLNYRDERETRSELDLVV